MITLSQETIPAKIFLDGNGTFDIATGQTLKIETSPNGIEIFNETVPSGKKWKTAIRVTIEVQDA